MSCITLELINKTLIHSRFLTSFELVVRLYEFQLDLLFLQP